MDKNSARGGLWPSARNNCSLTEEHIAQLQPWASRWIANAMSTKPMDDEDRQAMRVAVRGLYEAAGLKPPPDHRIVFVPSPIVLRLASGFPAAICVVRRHGPLLEVPGRNAIIGNTREPALRFAELAGELTQRGLQRRTRQLRQHFRCRRTRQISRQRGI